MKKTMKFMFAALAIMVAASCEKNELVDNGKNAPEEITFSISTEPTKANIDASYKVNWTVDDSVSVLTETTNDIFKATAAEGTSATFAGTYNGSLTAIPVALYPYDENASYDGINLVTTLKSKQVPSVGAADPEALLSAGRIMAGTPGYMKNLTALLKLTIPEDGIEEIRIYSNGGEPLAGTVQYKLDEFTATTAGDATFAPGDVDYDIVAPADYIELKSATTFSAGETYYASILPGKYEMGIKIIYLKATTGGSKTGTHDLKAERNAIVNLGTPTATKTGPKIATADDLYAAFMSGLTAESELYVVKDIDFTGITLTTVPTFASSIEGLGYTFSNITSDGVALFNVLESTASLSNANFKNCTVTFPESGTFGLIANTNHGTITNVNVEGAFSKPSGTITPPAQYGMIAGISNGLITDCHTSGSVTFNLSSIANNSGVWVGAVAGQIAGTEGEDIIYGCTNDADVTFTITGDRTKYSCIGGITGGTSAHKIAQIVNNGDIVNCVNNGDVTLSWDTNNSGSYSNTGGVVGYMEGGVKRCTNNGNVTVSAPENATNNTSPTIGGVAACITHSSSSLHNNGDVTFTGTFSAGTDGAAFAGCNYQPCAGGVVGEFGTTSLNTSTGVKLEHCNNNGKLTVTIRQKSGGGTQSFVGGVAGYSSAETLNDITNNGEVICKAASKVCYTGGVIGMSCATDAKSIANYADVTFDGRAVALGSNTTNYFSYQEYVGGVIGFIKTKHTINDAYNTGKIKLTGIITTAAYSYLGGITGGYQADKTPNASKSTIKNSTNIGDVICDETCAILVGGISGGFNGTFTDCQVNANLNAAAATADPDSKAGEIGGIVGYFNGQLSGCSVQGTITGGPYAGGLCGGFGDATKQFENSTVNPTMSGYVTAGKLIGRYRNAATEGAEKTLYYKDMTFGESISALPIIGKLNGQREPVEGDIPTT